MMDVCISEVTRATITLKSFFLTYYLEGKQTTNDLNALTTKKIYGSRQVVVIS